MTVSTFSFKGHLLRKIHFYMLFEHGKCVLAQPPYNDKNKYFYTITYVPS